MGKCVSITNEKGGVGKSSITFSTIWEISKKKKVLVIDMDSQRANLTFIAGVPKDESTLTMYDIIVKKKPIKKAIVNIKKNLDIIPGTEEVKDLKDTKVEYLIRMRESLQEIKDDYDYIFFDTNGEGNDRLVYIFTVCDDVFILMEPDLMCLESNNGIIESIDAIKKSTNPNLKVGGIIFNSNEENRNLTKTVKEVADQYAKKLNSKVLKTKVRRAVVMKEVPIAHVGITDYDAKSPIAEDIRNLAKEITKEVK